MTHANDIASLENKLRDARGDLAKLTAHWLDEQRRKETN